MDLEQARIANQTVAYARSGQGPPLVLVHGGLADHRVWGRQIEYFSARYTVVAWDAPGTGASSDPQAGFDLGDYADCLAGVVDAAGLGPAHVVGHSFGGGVSIALQARRPDTVRSLTLVGAYAGWRGSLGAEEAGERLSGVLASLEGDHDDLLDRFAATLFGPAAPPEATDLSRRVLTDFRVEGARTMAIAFAEADLTDALPRVTVPTLIVHGEHDVRAPRAVADGLHRAIPEAELVVIPGAGHESYLEDPTAFNAALDEFLGRVGGS